MLLKFNSRSKYKKKMLLFTSVVTMQLIVFLSFSSFVSITLAEEDNRDKFEIKYKKSNSSNSNRTSEENYRSAGISFPTWDEFRESLKKFQDQINKLRRNGGESQSNNVSSTNRYRNSSPSGISGLYPPASSENPGNVADYPPGFYRRPTNQYNYVYKGSPGSSASADLQQHTTTTIYIICICLVIMVVGSVLFICVNKCQQNPENSTSTRTGSSSNPSNRNRTNPGALNSSNRNSRVSVSTISLPISSIGNTPSGSRNNISTDLNGSKIIYDLPPSYDSLFPNGKPPTE